ncbi:DUF882 domain-containing protein [bacterium]|nr:DUF882 domain-containing protein [bacterium]
MGRRCFLRLCGAAAAGCLLPAPALALASRLQPVDKAISLLNIHTGESLERVYRTDDAYVAETLAAVDHLLRDHRTGEVRHIDPRLLDQLYYVAAKLGTREPFHVVSGFRSARTNEMLRRQGHATAKRSFHLDGRAVDVRLPGVALGDVRRAARDLRAGGVGHYPDPGFVHLDTGPVRTW